MFASDTTAISAKETCPNSTGFTTCQVCHIYGCRGNSSHILHLICAHVAAICLGLLCIQKHQAHGQSPHKKDTSGENLTYFRSRHVGCGSEAVSWNTKRLDRECIWSKFCTWKKKKRREKKPHPSPVAETELCLENRNQERTVGTEQISWKRSDALEGGNCDTTSALCQRACLMAARHLAGLLEDDIGGAKTEEQVDYNAGNFELLFVFSITFSKSRPVW